MKKYKIFTRVKLHLRFEILNNKNMKILLVKTDFIERRFDCNHYEVKIII